ncbi:MAG: NAD-dependent epimerase/dehydratase family protein [Paraburkholderia sp.]|uniref:NAD-dependent epimerase/dehydratase family protein n=1 Tax=Paraburkholderia sp. TaxID=1926495 RepID=UPI00120190A4|nr:NAD-dependent epimerase/dehydratase family protein [Paraburkholderia sp.]TAM06460.1 MAG: NAD-dependent epimerase/dehydratase family protein [Paraburkholderia sp.]
MKPRPRAFVTGVRGFTGRYLAEELHRAGYEVFGSARTAHGDRIPGVTSVYACDILDGPGLERVLDEVKPDVVAHLAGVAFVAHGDAEAIYRANLLGSRSLLDALSRVGAPVRSVLMASSANVYGNTTGGTLDETAPPSPVNDYAVSKLAMEYMTKLYSDKLPIVIARPFNYTGVGQSEQFLLPKIVSHFKRRATVIELGNLDVARDFSDVRTVAQIYRKLLETPATAGETYNVCSGRAYTLDEVLSLAREISGHDIDVRVNPAFVRAHEVKKLIGSRVKLENTIGEVSAVPLSETLRWMLGEVSGSVLDSVEKER